MHACSATLTLKNAEGIFSNSPPGRYTTAVRRAFTGPTEASFDRLNYRGERGRLAERNVQGRQSTRPFAETKLSQWEGVNEDSRARPESFLGSGGDRIDHRAVAQLGRASRSGREGRRFKSCLPDLQHKTARRVRSRRAVSHLRGVKHCHGYLRQMNRACTFSPLPVRVAFWTWFSTELKRSVVQISEPTTRDDFACVLIRVAKQPTVQVIGNQKLHFQWLARRRG